jgi:hypothetical protein
LLLIVCIFIEYIHDLFLGNADSLLDISYFGGSLLRRSVVVLAELFLLGPDIFDHSAMSVLFFLLVFFVLFLPFNPFFL